MELGWRFKFFRARSYRIVVRGSACRAAICTSRNGTPDVEGGHDERRPQHVRMDVAEPRARTDGTNPALCGQAVESLAVTACKARSAIRSSRR